MYTATSKVSTVFTMAALFLLLVGCAVAAIVCPPGYCGRVRCEQVDEATCDGIVKQNATFCQCCPACIRLLGKFAVPLLIVQPCLRELVSQPEKKYESRYIVLLIMIGKAGQVASLRLSTPVSK
ncbi:hypothetical protein HPB51_017871 [Rhipicephalus microplus]|uniref:Secreted protein n=1 Tax=Rhipicephalus microplus TaxID=6941 RepID=A0A9J6E3F6_RHIMP|nr:hypothetical protein HPB51_017871 [Rhipicephalus microplus]